MCEKERERTAACRARAVCSRSESDGLEFGRDMRIRIGLRQVSRCIVEKEKFFVDIDSGMKHLFFHL